MNNKVILSFATIFGLIGAYVPVMFGDTDVFSVWSVLGSTVGGVFGIWLGIIVSKRLG